MNEQIAYYQNKLAYEMDSADLFEAFEQGNDIIVIDTRKAWAFEQEHIPQAINLPHREMNVANTKQLDKTKVYVCYCDGIGCNGSTKGALNMTKLGFRVKELIGGISWWKKDGYATVGEKSQQGKEVVCAC